MKHLRYFKESLDIGDIKALDNHEYNEYARNHEAIDVTEWDFKTVNRLIESIYEPEEIFALREMNFQIKFGPSIVPPGSRINLVNKGIMALVAVDKEIIDREEDGEDIIYFLKFEDHYWLVCHQRDSWDNPDRYWLVGDEDLDKLKNVIFE